MVLIEEQTEYEAFQTRLRQTVDKMGGIKPLSNVSGVPYSTLQKYLAKNGSKEPSRKALTQIVLASGISSDWLLTGAGDSERKPGFIFPQIEGIKDTVCIPVFSEHIYRNTHRNNFDLGEKALILRKAYEDMLNESYRLMDKEQAIELFGSYAKSVIAVRARDIGCGGEFPPVATLYIHFEDVNPRGGEYVLIEQGGGLYLTRANILGDTTFLDGFGDYSDWHLDYNKLHKGNSIVGRVIADTTSRAV